MTTVFSRSNASTSTGPLAPTPFNAPHLAAIGNWYHNFDSLGVHVPQAQDRPYVYNQQCKEPIILGYLQTAIGKARRGYADKPSVLELFCADGYYSCHARRMGAGRIIGIDLDQSALTKANAMFQALYAENNVFQPRDVFEFTPPANFPNGFDILVNCGGLYHLTDPRRLINESRKRFGVRFMVIQSAVTMESTAEDYFITPAPGWKHGSRFTPAFLRKAILDAGWNILDSHFNELEGNDRPCDRGSAYFLCQFPS